MTKLRLKIEDTAKNNTTISALEDRYAARNIIKEIPKTTYKKLFQGSYNRTKKYIPKKTRAKALKTINKSAF